ncbi:MAG: alpha/beta hydrolase [Lysobacteraceae bacterium]|nr:MAG: alpha/beta hydrolase [Xanthomonadaceae bacterium]
MRRGLAWLSRAMLACCALLLLVAAIAYSLPIRPTVPALRPRADTQYWPMQGGYRIAYTKREPAPGAPARLPVVFVHGGPGGYVHTSLIEALQPLAAAGHTVYFYDQHGSGLSDRLRRPKDSGFNDQVDDLHEIVETHLGAGRVNLIGHSHGARIAAHYAARHPERVARLVLSSPGNLEPALQDDSGHSLADSRYPVPRGLEFRSPDAEQYRSDTALSAMPAKVILAQAIALAFNVKTAADSEVDAALNTLAARFTRNMVCDPARVQPEEGGAGLYVRTGANWFGDVADPRPAMRRFRGRVLVLQGQCDFMPYADAYEYVDTFAHASYRFIAGAGHILWWERPEVYAQAVRDFFTADPQETSGGQ